MAVGAGVAQQVVQLSRGHSPPGAAAVPALCWPEVSVAAGTAGEGWQVEVAAGEVAQLVGWWLPGTWAPVAGAGSEGVQQTVVAHGGGGAGGRAPPGPSVELQRFPERPWGEGAPLQQHHCSGQP